MKSYIIILFCLTTLILLTACNGRITEGEVIAKDFQPAWVEASFCNHPISMYMGNGKTKMKDNWLPCTINHPDRWSLQIKYKNIRHNEYRKRWVTVTNDTYNYFNVGDWWYR